MVGNSTALTDIIDTNGLLMLVLVQTKLFFITLALLIYQTHQPIMGLAHVHATGGLYFAHGGNWIRLNDETTGPVTKYVAGLMVQAHTLTGPGATSGDNPNFTFYKGHTYLIDNTANVSSHPLQIRTSNGGSAFTTGVTENFNSTTGLTQFIVPHEPSDTSLVYQCTNHSSMVGNITIV